VVSVEKVKRSKVWEETPEPVHPIYWIEECITARGEGSVPEPEAILPMPTDYPKKSFGLLRNGYSIRTIPDCTGCCESVLAATILEWAW